ncbi:MAG: glycoside hydrolase family 9 protein [Fibrobacterota bacterium]
MSFKRLKLVISLVACLFITASGGIIHVNQEGFYPDEKKVAIVIDATSETFSIISSDGSVAYEGALEEGGLWDASGENTTIADFSELTQIGEYKIQVEGCDDSWSFEIKSDVHERLTKAAMKAYYFNRASFELEQQYAGQWAREAGHPDDNVIVHPSAASEDRPDNSTISSPGGWYDAGDYGKYIVNSGISMHTLLSAYEAFPHYYDTLSVGIPESNNDIPDILDEALYNLRWMLTMQDPHDGGVYHKLTSLGFCGMDVRPSDDNDDRYVIQKTTTATLDFAAVCAQAARILRKFENELPGLADSCLQAARDAWDWAQANSDILYDQREHNQSFDPDVVTGAYGDSNAEDEFKWAGVELYLTTREDSFFTSVYPSGLDSEYGVPGWPNVATLGLYSLFLARDSLTSAITLDQVETSLFAAADELAGRIANNPYRITMTGDDYYWGSNSVAANQGVMLMIAYLAGENQQYKDAAVAQLDYLMGRNPTGYCYVGSIGDKTVMNPHHRPSSSDGVEEPVPGFLAGGPNPGQQDNTEDHPVEYPSSLPAKSYVDHVDSYASNEVTINWNAPLVFLAGALEATQASMHNAIEAGPGYKKSFSPAVKLKDHTIAVHFPGGWCGEVIFSDLRGKTLKKAFFDGERDVHFKTDWSNQITLMRISASDRRGKMHTVTRKLVHIGM